ncbi:biotin--[acetyl-CoA-carboxylase] ligase [Roseibacillus persicicus]|uniref:biotin--[acetyl-CoA-carboxylase] ligase n=1 Tax=Roseibacillus persicicus TaxID=454148 RepID=UPI00280E9D12|nr:biotin--[acetyl-CoA-carboxylase] ligase [Roseibacillus persicicus]MDQ8188815.1 biotin--[acetyl-CoA-carboxylase] ligase [Roseibacillus persicicus]
MSYDLAVLRGQLGERLHYFEEIGSTNEEALRLGRAGAIDGSVIVAERQLAGRGRRGASWFCGEGKGLAFSMLLRPQFERALWPRLSLVAGLAVAKAIEVAGLFPEVKWPNDVLIGGRKVCGILMEAEKDFAVVGIGLNVGQADLPQELREVATSLETEGAGELARETYLLRVEAAFVNYARLIATDFPYLVEMLRERCALEGKKIEFLVGQDRREGFCQGIGDGGELLVRNGGKVERYFAADQIRPLL